MNILFVIILLLPLLLLLFYLSGFYFYFAKQQEKKVNNLEIVVSRYNENLKWINTNPFNKYPLTIYNKGLNNDFEYSSRIKKVINTKNVGREGHTYLLHIIKNYENLADFTVFLPGSLEHIEKLWKAKTILYMIENNNESVFIQHKLSPFFDIMDFEIDEYQSTSAQNLLVNDEKKLLKSDIRPFGKWYKHYFNDIKLDSVSYGGVLGIKKEDILQHSKEYYEKFLDQLSSHSNPEVGHYIERTWSKIINPSQSSSKIMLYNTIF